jgi:hypothetical protein
VSDQPRPRTESPSAGTDENELTPEQRAALEAEQEEAALEAIDAAYFRSAAKRPNPLKAPSADEVTFLGKGETPDVLADLGEDEP